jgi:hypothetical protein
LRGLFDGLLAKAEAEDPRGIEYVLIHVEGLLDQYLPRAHVRSGLCHLTGTPVDAVAVASNPCDAFLVGFLGKEGEPFLGDEQGWRINRMRTMIAEHRNAPVQRDAANEEESVSGLTSQNGCWNWLFGRAAASEIPQEAAHTDIDQQGRGGDHTAAIAPAADASAIGVVAVAAATNENHGAVNGQDGNGPPERDNAQENSQENLLVGNVQEPPVGGAFNDHVRHRVYDGLNRLGGGEVLEANAAAQEDDSSGGNVGMHLSYSTGNAQ